jgi:hypothetical protein
MAQHQPCIKFHNLPNKINNKKQNKIFFKMKVMQFKYHSKNNPY